MTHQITSSGHQQQQQNHTIVQMPQQPQEPSQPNRPSLDLLHGNRKEYIKIGIPLYEAAIIGDWKAAKPILEKQPDLIRSAITENEETLLHVAASAERSKAAEEFVKNLLNLMDKADMVLQNIHWDTPLNLAAQAGNIETAKALMRKNPALIEIPNKSNVMPLYMAVLFEKPAMVRYLYRISNKMQSDFWEHDNRGRVLQNCVEADMFDVAIKIVNDHPELTDNKWLLMELLLALAQKPNAFNEKRTNAVFDMIKSLLKVLLGNLWPSENESELALQLLKIIWGKISQMPKSDIDDIIQGPLVMNEKKGKTYPFRVLFLATRMGNTRFIVELIRLYPDVIRKQDDKGKTIFHVAIKSRQENIYNLLYEIGAMKGLITPIKDKKGNNMLHMVAKSVKQTQFQSVVLQMQHELLWFKEVEKMIPPQYRKAKNRAGETPRDLFTKKHAGLVTKGEDWMKDTTSQCLVAATLIATITFAAAFTLPGGYNQETGIPFFRKESALIIFVISDAVSLIFSSYSIIMFLSIFLTGYTEYDFLESLPTKLVLGLITLFLSIVTMMVAFSASFYLLYHKELRWIAITITVLSYLPINIFILLQYPLIVDVMASTFGSRYLFKPVKRVLYY